MSAHKPNSIARFPVGILAFALMLTAASVTWLAFNFYSAYQFVEELKYRDIRCVQLRGIIVHLDEVLTMSARMAATTGDLNWERRYRQYEGQLDDAIKEATRLAPQPALAKLATQIDVANGRLVEMENRSFDLVRHGQLEQAKAVLFSPAYEEQKKVYAEGIGLLLEELNKLWETKLHAEGLKVRLAIGSTGVILILLLVAWFVAVRTLTRWRVTLASSNAALAAEITERKQAEEKAALQKQLMETAHKAGIAEVATSVLHNVGNALNSVNVSASVVKEKVTKSKLAGLGRVTKLMKAHAHDLGAFLTEDPQGTQLLPYFELLVERWQEERQGLLDELKLLTKYVTHIKDIIATQQSFTGVSGLAQMVSLSELLDDALQMTNSDIDKNTFKIVREYGITQPVVLDRIRVMMIMANLLRNAKEAVLANDRAEKQITIRSQLNGGGRAYVHVIDTGVGIAPENLTGMFAWGFTTKHNGHGFGLHSSALAAQEMGGSLRGYSAGVGRGAEFVLEIPIENHQKQTGES